MTITTPVKIGFAVAAILLIVFGVYKYRQYKMSAAAASSTSTSGSNTGQSAESAESAEQKAQKLYKDYVLEFKKTDGHLTAEAKQAVTRSLDGIKAQLSALGYDVYQKPGSTAPYGLTLEKRKAA